MNYCRISCASTDCSWASNLTQSLKLIAHGTCLWLALIIIYSLNGLVVVVLKAIHLSDQITIAWESTTAAADDDDDDALPEFIKTLLRYNNPKGNLFAKERLTLCRFLGKTAAWKEAQEELIFAWKRQMVALPSICPATTPWKWYAVLNNHFPGLRRWCLSRFLHCNYVLDIRVGGRDSKVSLRNILWLAFRVV